MVRINLLASFTCFQFVMRGSEKCIMICHATFAKLGRSRPKMILCILQSYTGKEFSPSDSISPLPASQPAPSTEAMRAVSMESGNSL